MTYFKEENIMNVGKLNEHIIKPIPCRIIPEIEYEFKNINLNETENEKYLNNIYGNEQIIKRVKSEYKYNIFNFINENDKYEIKKSCSAPPKISQLSQDTTEMKLKRGVIKSNYTKF